jgi:hypothetical protein
MAPTMKRPLLLRVWQDNPGIPVRMEVLLGLIVPNGLLTTGVTPDLERLIPSPLLNQIRLENRKPIFQML